ncbi:hypothetical protein O3H76_002349 [Escherichia coli]|nr:hypothetical protein [Escherichia coli]
MVFVIFLFSISLKTTPVTVGAVRSSYVFRFKLLRDIEKLLKKEIPRIAIPGYEPDPSIKAEPIQNGRQQRGGIRLMNKRKTA